MVQGFEFNEPVLNSPLVSQPVRTNFQALATDSAGGSAPISPVDGMRWLDTSDSPNLILKYYVDGEWHIIFRYDSGSGLIISSFALNEFSIDFFEGNNPPYIADIDAYGFQDAAGFPVGEDRDVIFKVESNLMQYKQGIFVTFLYTMSSAESSKMVRLSLDYVVHAQGELYSGGTPYNQVFDVPVIALANTLALMSTFVIPNGHVTNTTVSVECRLTRVGTHAGDTHTGDFGLKNVVILAGE